VAADTHAVALSQHPSILREQPPARAPATKVSVHGDVIGVLVDEDGRAADIAQAGVLPRQFLVAVQGDLVPLAARNPRAALILPVGDAFAMSRCPHSLPEKIHPSGDSYLAGTATLGEYGIAHL